MAGCYVLKLVASPKLQTSKDHSFIGGQPKLPPRERIPRCGLCGSEESFFFQVAFPEVLWKGLSLAVFACTSCADKDHLIPPMLPGPLAGANIPDGFLDSYQINFRLLVFETASAMLYEKYQEKVTFKRFSLKHVDDPKIDENKIGGVPNWLFEDESPKSYDGKSGMFFLLQLLPEFQFEINDSARRQIEPGLDGSPKPSSKNYYDLFIGNKLFLFGTEDRTKPLVYAITQVD